MSVKDYADMARSGKKFPVEMEMMKTAIKSNQETTRLVKQTIKYMRLNFWITVVVAIAAIIGIALSMKTLLIKIQELQ